MANNFVMFRLNKELNERLKIIADKKGVSVTPLIIVALDEYARMEEKYYGIKTDKDTTVKTKATK